MSVWLTSHSFLLSCCLWSSVILSEKDELDSYHDSYQEICQTDSHCPEYMHCQFDMCTCNNGYSFSHPFASCEQSKKMFRNFKIDGPLTIQLPSERVVFRAKILKESDVNWRFQWVILDGINNAKFSGVDGPVLTLTELKAGFILFGLSISSEDLEGYAPHNLTIIDVLTSSISPDLVEPSNLSGVKIIECGRSEKENDNGIIRVWLPRRNIKLCGFFAHNDKKSIASFKWARLDHSLKPVDILGSSSPMLELLNFQATEKHEPYEFLLTTIDMSNRSANATVKLIVSERPKLPEIKVRNATLQLPEDSVTLEATIPDHSIEAVERLFWDQTEGPVELKLRDRHSLNQSISGIRVPGVYVFRIRAKNSAGDSSNAFIYLNVEQDSHNRPVVHAKNVSVTLPCKQVTLEVAYWKNVEHFEWEPDDDVPAIMLLDSNLIGDKLMLTRMVSGRFLFKLIGTGTMGIASTIVQIEVNRGLDDEHSLELMVNRREVDQAFSFRDQKSLVKTIEEILRQKFGLIFLLDVTNIVHKFDGYLSIRLFYSTQSRDKNIHNSEVSNALYDNASFLEFFQVTSIKSTFCTSSSNDDCQCDPFRINDVFHAIFHGSRDRNCSFLILYVWLLILFVFVVLSKMLHLLWKCQEREDKQFSEIKQRIFAVGRNVLRTKGRFSPIGIVHKRKGTVVQTLNNVEANYGLLADKALVDEMSDFEEHSSSDSERN